jgi:hypothetical protein
MLIVMGITMCIVENAYTDEFKLTPSLDVKEEYNDNILSTSTDTQKDFITTLSPGLALTDRTERMDLSLLGRLDYRLYSSYSDNNATDQYYEGTGKYAFTPRLDLSGKALYSVNSNHDRDFATTGLLLTNVKRIRQNYTISGGYQLSEKTMTTFSYDYLNDKYDSVLYNYLKTNTSNLGFIRDISNFLKSTKATINMGYTKSNTPGMKTNNYEATIGIDHTFDEKWSMLLDGGGRYTNTKFQISELQQEESNHSRGTVGHFALTYKGEQNSGSLNASIDLLPASGYSGSTERTSFVLNLSRRFTYELYGTLSGGYYINKSRAGEFSTQEINENTMSLSPSVRYEFDKDKSLEASYTYNRTKDNGIGSNVESNIFRIRFRIQHHLFE